MALFSGKGMVIFKLKDLEKSYIMDLTMHDITKTSHTTRFFASLKKVMPDLQMCTTSKNVNFVFLAHGIKDKDLEDTSTNAFSILQKSAKILGRTLKEVEFQFSGALSPNEDIPV